MADVRARVAAEMENIQKTLAEIPPHSRCPDLSTLELAGVAALFASLLGYSMFNGTSRPKAVAGIGDRIE